MSYTPTHFGNTYSEVDVDGFTLEPYFSIGDDNNPLRPPCYVYNGDLDLAGIWGNFKSKGTYAAPTIVADTNLLGSHMNAGYDGSEYLTGGGTRTRVQGTPLLGDMPTVTQIMNRAVGAADVRVAAAFNADHSVELFVGGTSSVKFENDGTKTTISGVSGDYFRIGDAATTSVSLSSEDDLLVTGSLEVDGAAYLEGNLKVDTIEEATASNGVTIDGLNIENDGTTTTFLGTSGDYLRIGDAGTTSNGLSSEDDLYVSGKFEVKSNTYLPSRTTVAGMAVVTIDADSSENRIRVKTVEIGDWDMDATATVSVAHGETYGDIIGVWATVRNDADSLRYTITGSSGSTVRTGEVSYWDSTNVRLDRRTSGTFDSTNFDSTSYNRGWVYILLKT